MAVSASLGLPPRPAASASGSSPARVARALGAKALGAAALGARRRWRRSRLVPRLRGRGWRGYSLVGVMVALALVGIGIMSLVEANTSTVLFQNMARNRTVALAIAGSHLEEMRMQDPWSLRPESGVPVDDEGIPNPTGTFLRSVVLTELQDNLVEVTVTVSYPRGGVPIALSMQLFRAVPLP